MSELKIDKDVPIPGHEKSIYVTTAMKMDVGDSVLVEDYHQAKCLSFAIRDYCGGKAEIKAVSDIPTGYRVWRIK